MLVLILGTLWYMSSLHNKAAEVAKMAREEEEDTGAGRRGHGRKGRRPVPKGKVKKADSRGDDAGEEADGDTGEEAEDRKGDEAED